MKKNAVLWILIIVFVAGIISTVMAGSVSKPILKLIAAAQKMAHGDFDQKVLIKTHDELEDLASTFNQMSTRIKVYNEMQIDKIIMERTKTKAIIFSILDGLILTDYEGKILLLNDQAYKMFRLPVKPEEGKSVFDFFKDKKEFIGDFFKEVIGKKGENVVKEFDLSEGEYKKFLKTATSPVTTKKGDEIGTVTVIRDITLEKEIDEMKDAFVHSITHDLRNPLASMMGFMDLIALKKAGALTDKQEKYLGIMKKEATRLLGMINDILDVAKLEAGKMELNLEETDINKFVENAIQALEGTAMRKGIELKKEIPAAPLVLNCDGDLLQRVIINLMGNSLNHTQRGGSITVSTREIDDNIQVRVTDTGAGMPPEYCEKIFEKFQQVKGREKSGTGLGLTISKQVVLAHKGKIWAESELGKGSRFYFEIPQKSKD